MIANSPISCREIAQKFPHLILEIVGDADRKFCAVSGPENTRADAAIFLGTRKALNKGLGGAAQVIVVNKNAKAEVEAKRGDRTLIIASNAELAMAAVVNEYFLKTPYTSRAVDGVHPTAVISPKSQLGGGVRVGPFAVIGANVQIGRDVYIGAHSVIEDESTIGEGTVIHPLVFVGHSTMIGKHCEIHPQSVIGKEGFGYAHDEKNNHYRIPHQGVVILEDDVHIGSCVTIDRGTFGETRVERGTKVDNQAHLAHNSHIGRNSLLTAGFAMAGSSRIGANFVAGGRSNVTGHIEICDNVQIAGLSGVTKEITTPGQYAGYPLVGLQQFLKIKAAMVQLPAMRKQLSAVLKHLGLNEERKD